MPALHVNGAQSFGAGSRLPPVSEKMAQVFIPPQLRELTHGQQTVEAVGTRLRGVIEDLDRQFPGIAVRLIEESRLVAGIAVAIDGALATLGLLTPVAPASEVHFLPAVGGG